MKRGMLPSRLFAQSCSTLPGWLTEQATSDRSVFLVAEREPFVSQSSALVAFVVGTIEAEIPIYRLKEFGFIYDLWVEPNYRKLGLGRQLTERALQAFSQKGIQQVRLDTAIANEAARQLFPSLRLSLQHNRTMSRKQQTEPLAFMAIRLFIASVSNNPANNH